MKRLTGWVATLAVLAATASSALTQGTIKIGESMHLGYVDQSRDALDGSKNV